MVCFAPTDQTPSLFRHGCPLTGKEQSVTIRRRGIVAGAETPNIVAGTETPNMAGKHVRQVWNVPVPMTII